MASQALPDECEALLPDGSAGGLGNGIWTGMEFSILYIITFISDHCQPNGSITESWLDHVYHSEHLKDKVVTNVLNYGSSDHLPVTVCQKLLVNRKSFKKKIVKRKMKNFTDSLWNESLQKRDWSSIQKTNDLEKKWNYSHH